MIPAVGNATGAIRKIHNMEKFDVIVVGGGSAGLQCARVLSQSDLRILLLEKDDQFGDKLCAGGLTLKGMRILELPDHVIEYKITRAAISSRRWRADTVVSTPYLFTVNRKELGAYQRQLLDGTSVVIKTNSQVTGIDPESVTLQDGSKYGYRYLVGADGYASIVRRYLNLKVRKKLIGFQYTIPVKEVDTVVEIFLDARRFHVWYAWTFPHRNSMAVGCCCNPDQVDHQRIKAGFHDWLKEMNIDPGGAKLESGPVAYDYQGFRFGNIFLAGEAAGLASGFTGEGVYQALASGQDIARIIMDPAHKPDLLDQALKYNRTLERVMAIFRLAGPMRGSLQELLVYLMTRKRLRTRINAEFS